MRVEIRVFYPKISQRSCYVQHFTCTQKVAMHSMFNIKEFNAGFSTLYYTNSKCNLHGYSAFSMRFHCRKSALKEEKKVRRVFYPHSIFKTNEFQACFSTFYFTWEKFVHCAFALLRMRVETRVFYPKISHRSYYVQHFTCTQKLAIHSMFKTNKFQHVFQCFTLH